jgi:hypothetical protein
MAELFDPAKDAVDVARVFTEDAALQRQGVALAGTVADVAVAADTLVGVEAQNEARNGLRMTSQMRMSVILSSLGREWVLTLPSTWVIPYSALVAGRVQ